MMFDVTNADIIYHTPIDQGAIYVLRYHGKNEKKHTTVDKLIESLDTDLKVVDKTQRTFFKSINSEYPRSSKVLSFKRGARKHDHLYRKLFDKKDHVLADVIVWMPGNVDISTEEGDSDLFEFDVIKKRKAMDAPENAHEENEPDALAVFEDFELSVLSALESIQADEEEFRRREMMEYEESVAEGIPIPPNGGVYFAWSQCLNCMKIGFTRKEDPKKRLRELSRYVTSPFTLAAWLPTPTPLRFEAVAHLHFKDKRINFRGSGAGTEFFRIDEAEAVTYVVGRETD